LRKEPYPKADFNVEKAILCILIKFVALFSKIKTYVNVKTMIIIFFFSNAINFEKRAFIDQDL